MKKLVTVLLLSVSSLVSAQNIDPNTGSVQVTPNVIDSTQWNNVIRMNSGQLGQVEGTGGGPVPAFNTDTNTIRFSFMPYTVSQIRAIEQVLSGQNISVIGFNYSWKIYNDLNNGSGTRGTLSVTGQLADKSGNVLESYFQDYSNINTGATFQTFSGTETFGKSYQLNSLGYVGLAWTGSDMNFWSGYYGPRVRDTSLTLNYSVKQPTSNTAPTPTTTSAGVPTATEIATAASLPPPESEPTSPKSAPPPTSEPSTTGSPPPPPGSEPPPGSPPPPNSSTTSQPPPSGSSQPAPVGSPQPSNSPAPNNSPNPTSVATAGPAQQQQAGATSSGPSLSSILTTIKNNEKKEQAIAQAAVSGANEVAQAAVQAAEQTALSVAATSSASSMASVARTEQKATGPISTTNSSSSQVVSLAGVSTSTSSASVQQSMQMPTQVVQNTFTNNTSVTSNNTQTVQSVMQAPQALARAVPSQTTNTQTNNNNVSLSMSLKPETNNSIQFTVPTVVVDNTINLLQPPTTVEAPKPTVQMAAIEMKNLQDNDLVVFSNNFLTNRANPLTEIVENNTRPTNNSVEQKESTLNRNATNNELAGNVQLENMAVQPVGYNAYLQLALRDVAFYAPKEIYRNQRVIDNQRAVRLLNFASELKHQEMVNQQYGEK